MALSQVTARLWPLLATILQAEAAPLIGAGFMRVGPGAAGQELHNNELKSVKKYIISF